MTKKEMKQAILKLQEADYKLFLESLIEIENSEIDSENIVNEFMENDSCTTIFDISL